jgi:hypothetical protein
MAHLRIAEPAVEWQIELPVKENHSSHHSRDGECTAPGGDGRTRATP